MKTDRFKKIMKQIEDVMAAISFAEEGEGETAASLMKREYRVLAALDKDALDFKTLRYAVNTAKRIGASLDILLVSSGKAGNASDDGAAAGIERSVAAEGVGCHVIQKTGCLKQRVIEYTKQEKEILFVVVESPKSLDAGCSTKDSALSELWRNLNCPLVVVAGNRI